MTTNKAALGKTIKEHRIAQNLTISELAQKAGVSQPYLSQVEKGSKPAPSERVLTQIAEALGLPAAVLLAAKGAEIDSSTEIALFFQLQQRMEKISQMFYELSEEPADLIDRWSMKFEKQPAFKQTLEDFRKELGATAKAVEERIYPEDMQLLIGEMFLLRKQERSFLHDVIRSLKKLREPEAERTKQQ